MKFLLFFVLVFGLVGCSEQTLTQQDNKYFESMSKINNEFDASLGGVTPAVTKYIEDRSNAKELNAPAEKLRKQIISTKKQFQSIKPPSGFETEHKLIIESMDDYKNFAEKLVRLSNATDPNDSLLNQAKDDLNKGGAKYHDQFVTIKKRSGSY